MTAPKPRGIAPAFASVLTALSELAAARGHTMSAPQHDEAFTSAMQCSRCERWVVFTVQTNGRGDPTELRGDALASCPGTPYGPVATTDSGLRSPGLADGTMA